MLTELAYIIDDLWTWATRRTWFEERDGRVIMWRDDRRWWQIVRRAFGKA